MRATRLTMIIGICVLGLLTLGCQHYRVSLNEQDLQNKRQLFTGYSIADDALAQCVQTAIRDRTLQQASGLTQLNCAHMGVRSLEGIQIFDQLAFIDVSHNLLGGITPLLRIKALKTVRLNGNPGLICDELMALEEKLDDNIQAQCTR